jgi:hypothetical protein
MEKLYNISPVQAGEIKKYDLSLIKQMPLINRRTVAITTNG